jgi:glycosyltransferase involved in cell wall biosynthesis
MNLKKIAIVVPALNTGGFQRVSVVLANYFANKSNVSVCLISFSNREVAFHIDPKVKLIMPDFDVLKLGFIQASLKTIIFLRKLIKKEKFDSILSFGDRINALTVICKIGYSSPVFISNRRGPDLSNGFLIDFLNIIFYPFATGIIAQTEYAKKVFKKKYIHKNIAVIPNPFPQFDRNGILKEKIVLNVGRFISSKHQDLLYKYFSEVNNEGWKLIFLGDGKHKNKLDELLMNSLIKDQVEVLGFQKNPEDYYRKSSIFAFTTTSEGFPNALGEAMGYGCASISFDCVAGPSDLIKDGENGYLVKNFDHETFKSRLSDLMTNEELRNRISEAGEKRLHAFSENIIAEKFFDFITNTK